MVVGLGSMGKRRVRLLGAHCSDQVEVFGVDTRMDRRSETEQLFGIRTYADLDEAVEVEQPSAALICTSPQTHPALTVRCLNSNLHVFSEINLLATDGQSIIDQARTRSLRLFLSSTLLYRKEIDYIKHAVNMHSGKVHYRYHVGQYLPDWHPWESYKDFFVADQATNGCRELFAIELPWIQSAFGPIRDYHVLRDNISSLEIDYPDSYIVSLIHEGGHMGVLHVDIVSRRAGRHLEVYGDGIHICWEGTPDSLSAYQIEHKRMETISTYEEVDYNKNYAANIIENAYLDELLAFIAELEGRQGEAKYTFADGLSTLAIIDKIEGLTQ